MAAKLPIHADNPADWLYAHMTQKTLLLQNASPNIPIIISNIIMKLLEKSIEDRYQSAYSLMRDFEECKSQLEQTGKIMTLSNRSLEASPKLNLPNNIVGREKEKILLESLFNSAYKGQMKIALVSGYPALARLC